MYKHFFKRVLDIVFSVLMLLLLWWLMLIAALMVRLSSKGPVIYRQERLGRGGKVFRMYKFRSMHVGLEKTGSGVYSDRNDPRITWAG